MVGGVEGCCVWGWGGLVGVYFFCFVVLVSCDGGDFEVVGGVTGCCSVQGWGLIVLVGG